MEGTSLACHGRKLAMEGTSLACLARSMVPSHGRKLASLIFGLQR
jgi:hypothetical protein